MYLAKYQILYIFFPLQISECPCLQQRQNQCKINACMIFEPIHDVKLARKIWAIILLRISFRFVTMQLRHNRVKKSALSLLKRIMALNRLVLVRNMGYILALYNVHLPQKYISQAEHSILTYLIYEIQYLYPVPL